MDGEDRERERLRQERVTAEETAERSNRNRLLIGYAVVSTVVLAVAVLVFVLASDSGEDGGGARDAGGAHINFNAAVGSTNGVEPDERAGIVPAAARETSLKAAAARAGCELRLRLADEGHEHMPPSSPEPAYRTNPATSGNHVDAPFQQADGAYLETPEAINLVHSLEHGRMAIQYSPELPEEAQLELKGLYDTMYGATLLFPNAEMPYEVAAATWTNLLGCPTYKRAATLDAIRAFGKATWGKYGGEEVFAFTFTGPTPAEPAAPEAAE
ncbi:MAG TPA: DUF3105 domain-containing protein [Solirubrobacterales bacterium]|nr:DUF3105 domain-containing protein [Solirubrobacterales bacterium]